MESLNIRYLLHEMTNKAHLTPNLKQFQRYQKLFCSYLASINIILITLLAIAEEGHFYAQCHERMG